MKKSLLILFLFCSSCYAGNLQEPIMSKDVPKPVQDYLQELYQNNNNLEVVTTDPNGNRIGNLGNLVAYNNSGTYTVKICTSSPSGTTWSQAVPSSSTNYEVINFTRDLTASSGDVNYSCTKGTPKAISVWTVLSGGSISSGNDDGTNKSCHIHLMAGTMTYDLTHSIFIYNADTAQNQSAFVKSGGFTNNQITLTWAKTGSPTGTAQCSMMVFY